jgi:hypothetical protein
VVIKNKPGTPGQSSIEGRCARPKVLLLWLMQWYRALLRTAHNGMLLTNVHLFAAATIYLLSEGCAIRSGASLGSNPPLRWAEELRNAVVEVIGCIGPGRRSCFWALFLALGL